MDENKASMYIVAMVGVVAAVGILVLMMSTRFSDDMTGQVVDVDGTNQVKSGVSGITAKSTLSAGCDCPENYGCLNGYCTELVKT